MSAKNCWQKSTKKTFFAQNTDSSESTVPLMDDKEIPNQADDNQPSETTEIRKIQQWQMAHLQ